MVVEPAPVDSDDFDGEVDDESLEPEPESDPDDDESELGLEPESEPDDEESAPALVLGVVDELDDEPLRLSFL